MRIVHLLNWKLNSINEILNDIKAQGFDAIQINPMQKLKSDREFHWWLSFQPLNFKVGNEYGTKEDLINLCQNANKLGLKVIVEVICTHMASTNYFMSLTPNGEVSKELLNNSDYWKPTRNGAKTTREDMIKYAHELPALNLNNKNVQNIVFNYLEELANCGVKGFCINSAKLIGLPSDGVNFMNEVNKFGQKHNLITYGEFVGGELYWKNEFSDYLPILTNHEQPINNIYRMITYYENYDSYLNINWRTTHHTSTEIINDKYYKLCEKFPNTIYYPRYKYSHNEQKNRSFLTSSPFACFELDFLEEDNIKKANQKKLSLY